MVISIAMVAEKGNPRLAGVLMGFPLGVGLTFLFLGIEQGPIFAAESALWSIPGVLTALAFCLAYSYTSQLVNYSRINCMILSTLTGLSAYFLVSLLLLRYLPESSLARTLVLIIFMPIFAFLFQYPKKKQNLTMTKVKLNCWVLFIRAAFAASIVIIITAIAKSVGPSWSGLFATFPTAILPTVLILHYLNGAKVIPILFREITFGMLAIIVFSIAVHFLYVPYGVYLGILLCYLVATCYIVIYEFTLRPVIRKIL